jgi:hypothetical protein
MNERMIQNALHRFRTDHVVTVPNINMAWGESDLLSVTRSGYIYDHEIKITRADFKADFGVNGYKLTSITKANKHDDLRLAATRQRPLPNYFMYVAPVDLLTIHDVPSYAGLMVWQASQAPFGVLEIVKKAPLLHKRKINEETWQQIARALMFRYWKLRQSADPRCPGGVQELV